MKILLQHIIIVYLSLYGTEFLHGILSFAIFQDEGENWLMKQCMYVTQRSENE